MRSSPCPPIRPRCSPCCEVVEALLETQLTARGVHVARLETGIKQPEAIGLYRRLGYIERPPFGSYHPDPLSIFMEKQLGA